MRHAGAVAVLAAGLPARAPLGPRAGECPNLGGVPDAPTWVPYVALVLSALSLVVSGLSYRAGGPRLSLQFERVPEGSANDPFPGGAAMRLTVVNAGRAAVTVQSFKVTPYGNRKAALTVRDVKGPTLPHRLEAHASETWYVDALPAARDYDAKIHSGSLRPYSSWPSLFRFTVAAGDGKSAHTKQTLDSLRLIADAQPKP